MISVCVRAVCLTHRKGAILTEGPLGSCRLGQAYRAPFPIFRVWGCRARQVQHRGMVLLMWCGFGVFASSCNSRPLPPSPHANTHRDTQTHRPTSKCTDVSAHGRACKDTHTQKWSGRDQNFLTGIAAHADGTQNNQNSNLRTPTFTHQHPIPRSDL